MVENSEVGLLCEEYKTLVEESSKEANLLGLDDSLSRLEGKLIINADWTKSGAYELMKIAEYYGIFMLRNALALAIALDYQDGTCGL